ILQNKDNAHIDALFVVNEKQPHPDRPRERHLLAFPESSSSYSFLLRQAFTDDEALTRIRSVYCAEIHNSFVPDISIAPLQVHCYSEALPTTALTLRWIKHAEALQASASEGLAQGPYVAGFEPASLRTEGTELNH